MAPNEPSETWLSRKYVAALRTTPPKQMPSSFSLALYRLENSHIIPFLSDIMFEVFQYALI
jgi:hypothetical protein